ncbi:MAG: triphosphoribosyl-dephospho-CoA synthase, partial [Caulobacteraceae bacterium]
AVLAGGGCGSPGGREALARLDTALTQLNASPGGAADMLAAALFIDAVEALDLHAVANGF